MSQIPIVTTSASDSRDAAYFSQKLEDLLNDALACGVVITVDLMPQEPLAMRNYRMFGHVRDAR